MDWTSVPGYRDEDPAHEVVERYARLSPFELQVLRDRLRSLAKQAEDKQLENPSEKFDPHFGGQNCKRLANMCERILSWHPYAARWDWDQIIGNSTLRGHAKAVRGALKNYPEEDTPTEILRTASAYHAYDPKRHREAMDEYIQEQKEKQSFPRVSKLEAWIEAVSEGYGEGTPHQRVGQRYREAGWSGAGGGREEIEKLTEAILWATESGSEDTVLPSIEVKIGTDA